LGDRQSALESLEVIMLDIEKEKFSERMKTAIRAVKSAGLVVLEMKDSQKLVFSSKDGKHDFSTEADLASERVIIETVTSGYPNASILTEESQPHLENPNDVEELWVIDPIDGTLNFKRGRGFFAISVSYVEKGVPKATAVLSPVNNKLYYAFKDGGAYLNGKKIEVSNQEGLVDAYVTTDTYFTPEVRKRHLDLLEQIGTPYFTASGSGILSVCEVAEGATDFFFHTNFKPWDKAGPTIIVQEAGGVVVDTDITSPMIIAGNKTLVNEFIRKTKILEKK